MRTKKVTASSPKDINDDITHPRGGGRPSDVRRSDPTGRKDAGRRPFDPVCSDGKLGVPMLRG